MAGKNEIIQNQDKYPELLANIYIESEDFWKIKNHNRKYILSMEAPKEMTDADLDMCVNVRYLNCELGPNFTKEGYANMKNRHNDN